MTKVNRERIRKWVEALRSGEYKQGQGALRPSDSKFCCLGVGCDVYRKAKNVGRTKKLKWTQWGSFLEEDYVLPAGVMAWFGVMQEDPTVYVKNEAIDADTEEVAVSLAQLNDNEKDFRYIASAIERTFLAPQRKAKATGKARRR